MSDRVVDQWKQRGRISVWKRHVDWNITADAIGCDALLDLLDRMKLGRWPSQKSLALFKSPRTATTPLSHPAVFASEWVVKYPKLEVADDFWRLEAVGSRVKLDVGLMRLQQLRDAVSDLKNGGGDYAIGGDDAPLWIWWFVD